ncbi:hypothetical protein [Streptomyces sp. NPDC085932]|uniref:hypothetical protein n=1 Tax=Streptomyces sp. NPDC085932 TaxID=3365741 RepID=UPI0037D8F10C
MTTPTAHRTAHPPIAPPDTGLITRRTVRPRVVPSAPAGDRPCRAPGVPRTAR